MPTETEALPMQSIGNYDLIEKIAEGGMGAVYKGKSRATGQIVAIKIVPSETAKNQILLRRFEMEFKAASALDHPNIVKAIDYNGIGIPFLVMEFVDGESLGQKVEREGPLKEDYCVRIIAQVCDGLHKAHKQSLIHRDVKPDNVLVRNDGVAKLTDLGLVKDVEAEQNLTRTGRGLGTPHFMAPEQFRNAKNADVRCDIYSLGATLYMMLTGVIPFAKTNPLDCWMKKSKNDFPAPRKLNPKISERVDWAIRRAMSADPNMRPATCREFVEDLTGNSAHINGAPSSAIPPIQVHPDGPPTIPGKFEEVLWYMVYRSPEGNQLTVKGLTSSIRENLKRGTLGDHTVIMVSKSKQGPFLPLRSTVEFRDFAVVPGEAKDPKKDSNSKIKTTPAFINTPEPIIRPSATTEKYQQKIQNKQSKFNLPSWAPWAAVTVLAILVAIMTLIVTKTGK